MNDKNSCVRHCFHVFKVLGTAGTNEGSLISMSLWSFSKNFALEIKSSDVGYSTENQNLKNDINDSF